MNWYSEDDKLLRRYLLNDVTAEEQRLVEESLLNGDDGSTPSNEDEPDFVDRLLLVEDELIDDYVCGEMSEQERSLFDRTIQLNPLRRQKLAVTQELVAQLRYSNSESSASNQIPIASTAESSRWRNWFNPSWKTVVYTSLMVLVIAVAWWALPRRSDVEEAAEALKTAYRDWRTHESRVTGFDYALLDRSRDASVSDPGYADHEHAEILIRSLARKTRNSATLHLLGRMYLARKEYDKAIEQLQAAQIEEPKNARICSDLGAALLEKAQRIHSEVGSGERLIVAGQSLESLNKALEIDPALLEARFNRALCLELLGSFSKAKEEWENYLKTDSGSGWEKEARQHLAKLREQENKQTLLQENLRESFEQSLQNGNEQLAWQSLSAGRLQTGNPITNQLIEDILLFSNQKLTDSLAKTFHLLQQAGDLEERKTGDRFTAEIAIYYKTALPSQLALSAQAREFVRQGHARRTSSVKEAIGLFQKAGIEFRKAGNISEALLADWQVGKNLIWASELDQAIAKLQSLSRSTEDHRFWWLRSQAFYQLGVAYFDRNEFSKSLELISQSLQLARRLEDSNTQSESLITLADQHYYLGDYQGSLDWLEKSFSLTGHAPRTKQISWRNYQEASLNFASLGLFSVAIEYQKEALRLAEAIPVPVIKARSYTFLGWLYGKIGAYDSGISNLGKAIQIGEENQDDPVGQNIIADSSLQLGTLHRLKGEFAQSLICYERQIAFAKKLGRPFDSYWAHQGKFLSFVAQNDRRSAMAELQTALKLFDLYRKSIGQEQLRNGFFDTSQETYDAAVSFAYFSLSDANKAFEYAEISRARSLLDSIVGARSRPLSLVEIQARLPRDVQLVMYAVLEDSLIVWVVNGKQPGAISHLAQPIGARALSEKVNRYLKLTARKPLASAPQPDHESEELYELLIEPIRSRLADDKQLCIIPDRSLCYLPFGALRSEKASRYLIEDMAINVAPSATTFLACVESARKRGRSSTEQLLAVGDPLFDRVRFPELDSLKDADREIRDVARYYPNNLLLSGGEATEMNFKNGLAKADVVHLATHGLAERRSSLNLAIVLAPTPTVQGAIPMAENDGLLHVYEIYPLPLSRTRLVVLSACQSGIEAFHRGEGMIGLARPFLAAGVPQVISSLWKVDSEATANLTTRFHKHRKQEGLSAVQALRRAQREFLQNEQLGYQHPYYWAAFTSIGGGGQY